MAAHRTFHLHSKAFNLPVEVKLNLEDSYIRISAPFHEVLQVRPQLFNHHHLAILNPYGLPLFQLQVGNAASTRLLFQQQNAQPLGVAFDNTLPLSGRVSLQDKGLSSSMEFEVLEQLSFSPAELQMIGAALATCYLKSRTDQLVQKAALV